MADVALAMIGLAGNSINSFLNNNPISPILGLIEQKVHIPRLFLALGRILPFFFIFCIVYVLLGLFGVFSLYLIIGWGNDFVCNLICLAYPVYAS